MKDTDANESREDLLARIDMLQRQIDELKANTNENFHFFKMHGDLLDSVLNNSPSAVFLHRDLKFIYANPAALALFEMDHLSNIQGKRILDFIHPDFRLIVEERINRIFQTGCHLSPMPQKYLTKTGKILDVEAFGVLAEFEGLPTLMSIATDVTDRKRAEEGLRESEERYRIAFQTSPDSISLSRASDGMYIDINEGFTKLTGWTREEVLGNKSLDLQLWVDPDDRKRLVEQLRTSGYAENFEAEFRGKHGQAGVCHLSAAIIRIRDEDAILSIVRDVTERKKTETLLKESEARFRTAFENSAVGMALVGLDGKTIETNTVMAKMLGYDRSEILGKAVQEVMHPDDFEEHKSLFVKLLERKVQYGDSERRLIRKNGAVIDTQIWSTIHKDEHGKPLYLISIVRDISEQVQAKEERKRLESQLLQSQKMEAIGALAGGIAHDFNNILAAVIGFTELSMLSDGAPLEYLREAMKAAIRAKDLVKQILTFSRQNDEERKPVQVDTVVREAIVFLRATLPTSVEINYSTDDKAGTVMANSVELHQILMNLGSNAVHAIGENPGRVDIEVQSVTIANSDRSSYPELDAGPYVRLSVKDSGHGIPFEIQGRIFDPYFTTKEIGVGTGLGLAVIHGIVKKSNGTIRVESAPGKGSAFHIFLPQVHLPSQKQVRHKALPKGGSERILLVDDEKVLVDVGERILKRLGYDVVSRTSPIEALELFKVKPMEFDLVISDQTMPGMTGMVLASELMKINPEIPVVLCTGYSQQINQAKAEKKGIRALVMKPLLIDEIDNAIRRVLNEKL